MPIFITRTIILFLNIAHAKDDNNVIWIKNIIPHEKTLQNTIFKADKMKFHQYPVLILFFFYF